MRDNAAAGCLIRLVSRCPCVRRVTAGLARVTLWATPRRSSPVLIGNEVTDAAVCHASETMADQVGDPWSHRIRTRRIHRLRRDSAARAATEVGFVSIFFTSNISAATLLMGPGDRGQVVALAAANATARSEEVTAGVRWESSNPGVASITAAGGAITAISPGDADIRVFYRGATAQKRVTVFPPESVRQLQIAGQNQCWPGQGDLPWEVRATLDAGVIVIANSANWRVVDSRVAAISQSGTLTCGAVGSTVVEATYWDVRPHRASR